jgi:hypothetical protein
MNGELLEDLRLLEPVDPLQYAALGGGVLVFILAIWLLLKLLRRSTAVPQRNGRADAKAARKHALAALDQLSKLVDEGREREYAIQSSAVIREYIERRFGLRAPVLVTSEFLEHARSAPHLAAHHPELLAQYLRCCDLLKFGRGHADKRELQQLHAAAIRFVMETRFSSEEAAA